MCLELRRTGLTVAAVCPALHMMRRVKTADEIFAFSQLMPHLALARAMRRWQPAFVICVDDLAVRIVQALHHKLARSPLKTAKSLVALIERSLGDPRWYGLTEKSAIMAIAPALGIRCPRSVEIADRAAFSGELAAADLPVVLKLDRTSGGAGVRIARTREDAWTAYLELNAMRRKALLMDLLRSAGSRRRDSKLAPRVTIQQLLEGRPASCAVLCWQGAVIGGLSVEATEVSREAGPATVVRMIDHPEMEAAARSLTARLGLSGFCGYDFIIDSGGRAFLLEVNPRITPTCHLNWRVDLIGLLFSQITGRSGRARRAYDVDDAIALFPHEWLRNPASPHLVSCPHDVPWHEPAFVRTCLAMRGAGESSWRPAVDTAWMRAGASGGEEYLPESDE
jgi:ATP-grasp domain-containing protein